MPRHDKPAEQVTAPKKEHLGSDFDDFLREEQILEVAEATAAKRVNAIRCPPDGGNTPARRCR